MSDASTHRMIEMYVEEAEAPMFLSGHFRSPPENFHDTEEVELDIIRDDENVAVVISSFEAGAHKNENSLYTNKSFKPPIYDEEGAISAYDQIKRVAGQSPFQNPEFGANATRQAFALFRKLERKIRRAVELQSSQIFQTGMLTLRNQAGVAVYTLDFKPKSEHFVDTVNWAEDGSSGNPIQDVTNLSIVVRRNGKHNPDKLIFGTTAMRKFLANGQVQKLVIRDGLGLGQLAPASRGQGATFMGWVLIGHYRFEMWQYDGHYRDPVTGDHMPYVDDDNVIMLAKDARLDLTFGSIPSFLQPEARVLPFLPPRITSEERGLALTTNSWVTADGKYLMVSAGTRPLTIPTAIDTFGCLTVGG